ncbi:hypothetical protein COT44_02695 [Candidatus Shapirobacteria bacterium CG08_land_8_20_14_0_20_39_18]|uniref:DUF2085 domain-containing protein n=1 Tax=Candidatus Shapirobacteria bacterium CG08_land_8_20_14_0_20_39_18 TaxID=1974883 RepID=A0A2M6XCW4_9BACT|nr:MAG: hypothetical protein COT44_02695 [Candidatus Shapirobacteria bacterium CG08_land_8_20_14_0_20_39_18]
MRIIDNILFHIKQIGKNPICNLKSNRAPACCGLVFLFCYRCTGIIIGGIIAQLFYHFKLTYQSPMVLLLLATPCAIDGLTRKFKIQESNNTRRFATGLLFGIGLAFI